MRIRTKLIFLLACIVLLSTLFMLIGTIWLNNIYFKREIGHRFKLTGNLVQLSMTQKIKELLNDYDQMNRNKEITRSLLVALSAMRPNRTNFFEYLFSMAEFSKQHDVFQTSMHFISAANPKFQLYGVCGDEGVFSFSTKKDWPGQGLMELELDSYGFILPKKDSPANKVFKLPTAFETKKRSIDFYPTEKRLYLDIHFPLVNQSMGQSKDGIDEKSYGFAYIGLQYGVIRSFVELTSGWIEGLEKETGVNLDIFLADGHHGLGDLDTVPGKFNLSGLLAEDRIFKINLKDGEYLAAVTAIQINGKHLGYLVTSVRAAYLTNQIRNTAFTLLGIGLASLVLFIPLAFVLAYFYVRPVLDLEKNADQVTRGDLAIEINTNRKDEVGNLARSFANMRDSVRKKIEDLNQLNTELFQAKNELEQFSHNLEQKVKERTEELSRSEKNLAHAQRIARLGSWSWNILSDTITWSDEVYRIFGVTPRQFNATYEAFVQFIHPDDREMVQKAVQAALYEKAEYNVDHRIVLSDKSERIVHEEGQVTFSESDQPIKFVGIVQDITEQKKAMLELENAKRLADQANQAKSNFLASMSHELRTPLNAILGFSQLIARSQNLDAQDKEHLQIINRSGKHLLTLINDVLNMSKIESGRLTLNESDFDLYRMLDDVRNICRVQSEKKGLKLQFAKEPDVPQFVRTDETRLRQVLVNLINNAVKFTNEGAVTVRSRCGPVANPSDGIATIAFEIEDTGIGIEPDMLDQVFNPFVQDIAGTISGEGTGLGLPISLKIARLMHGDITVASTIGQGSLFTVTIQLNTRLQTEVQPQQAEQRILGLQPDQFGSIPRYRVLIVDDIESNRQVLTNLLSPIGFEVMEACNGREAIELWKKWQNEGHPPDLIWMDIRMPETNGYEATKEIKRLAETGGCHTVIIAISAAAFDQDTERILSAGGDDFVSKPFSESEIFEKMQKHLGMQYVYKDAANPDEPTSMQENEQVSDRIQDLPLEWRAAFKEAAELSDHTRMCSLTLQIHDQHTLIAKMIQEKIDRFDYDAILDILNDKAG